MGPSRGGRPLFLVIFLLALMTKKGNRSVSKALDALRTGVRVSCDRRDFVRFVRPAIVQHLCRTPPSRLRRRIYAELVRLEWVHDYHHWWLHDSYQ